MEVFDSFPPFHAFLQDIYAQGVKEADSHEFPCAIQVAQLINRRITMSTGRKAQYAEWLTEEGLLMLRGWARDGFSDKQIAQQIGVRGDTFCKWKSQFPQIRQALKKGRTPVALEIEEALYERCKWHKVTETVRKYTVGQDGNMTGEMRIDEYDKWIPPDTTAIIFTSKNLMPNKFRDKPQPTQTEEVEDDGLIDALKGSVDEIFSQGDDSHMVTQS